MKRGLYSTVLAHRIALAVILLAALALRLYGFRGFSPLDDSAYAQIAHRIAQGHFSIQEYDGPAAFPLRVGIIYPTSVLFRLFGVSEWSMVLFPFVLSLATIVLVYVAARHFFDSTAGVIAAAIWGILPLDGFMAGVLSPDLPAAFFGALGIVAALLMLESPERRWWVLFGGGIAAGVVFGVSWLCRESVAYAAPFCAFLLITTIWRDRNRALPLWTGVVAGSFLVLAMEVAAYRAATGDWLFRFHATDRDLLQYAEGPLLLHGESGYAKALVKRLVLTGPLTIFLNQQLLYLPLLAAVACLHAMYWRQRAFFIPGVWFASLVFMFNFASASTTTYAPLRIFDRFLYPVLLPATVIVAGFLGRLFDRKRSADDAVYREKAFWGTLTVAALLLVGLEKNYVNRGYRAGFMSEVKTVSTLLKPSDRLYTDILSIHALEFLWSYPQVLNTVNFEEMPPTMSAEPGAYVFINRNYLDWLTDFAGWWPTKSADYRKPDFHASPPTSWERIWTSERAVLYVVK